MANVKKKTATKKRRDRKVVEKGAIFRNPGVRLAKSNGRINESLFLDGVHPNEKGFQRIGAEIAFGSDAQ